MTSKKIVAYVGAFLLVVQSPLSAFASTPEPTLEEVFMQGFVQGFNNPTDTLDESLGELKPTPREQFHIDRITKQLEAIINKATKNEDKIQKAVNVNVYLLDTLVKHSKGMIEKAIAGQNDPVAMANLEKEIIATHIKSKIKIIVGAIMQISEIYLDPQINEYMKFSDDFQQEANQKDIDTAVQKITALVNMVDSAFENYAPEINKLMKTHIGISTKEFFQHARVLSFFGLQMMLDEENSDLNPDDEFDAKDIASINIAIGYLKNSLLHSDEKTKSAYTTYDNIVSKGGTIITYWESIKGSFNKDIADSIDMLIQFSSNSFVPISE